MWRIFKNFVAFSVISTLLFGGGGLAFFGLGWAEEFVAPVSNAIIELLHNIGLTDLLGGAKKAAQDAVNHHQNG